MRSVDTNRERVLGLIKTASVALTTKEMGRILKVKERSVRAAITWLIIGGFVEPHGTIISQTTPGRYGKRKFKIQVYQWTGKTSEICKIHVRDLIDNENIVQNLRTGKVVKCVNNPVNHNNAVFLQTLMMGMRKNG